MSRLLSKPGSKMVMALVAGTAALFLFHPGAGAQGQRSQGQAKSQAISQTPDAVPSGNADKGKQLFKTDGCYQCHGYSAQGGAGARLAPKPIPFKYFIAYVRQPKGEMPPFTAKVISDADLADIYAFLQSIPTPQPAKDIPLLNEK